MTEPGRQPDVTLLDACAVLSLFATRRMAEILAVVSGSVAVVDAVLQESLYVRRVAANAQERELVDLSPLVASGALAVIGTDDEDELRTFVDLSLLLDDGEAMTAAVALHRGYVLVTDDRKAERLLAGRVQLRSALDVIKRWADAERVNDDALRAVLTGVCERGYVPPSRHPLKSWWEGGLSTR